MRPKVAVAPKDPKVRNPKGAQVQNGALWSDLQVKFRGAGLLGGWGLYIALKPLPKRLVRKYVAVVLVPLKF